MKSFSFFKKFDIIFVSVIFISLLLLSGCSDGGNTSTNKFGKNSGKGMTLLIDDLPATMYDNSPVDIQILLKNEGYYTIPSSKLITKLSGYDPSVFNFQDKVRVLKEVEGIETTGASGFSDYLSFGKSTIKEGFLGENLPEINPLFSITACYPYQTLSNAEVCVNPDIYGKNPSIGTCRPGSSKVYNSEGPLTVTSVQERFVSYNAGQLEIKFDISISNIGKGKIWKYDNEDYMYECGNYRANIKEIQNKVNIVSVKLADQELDCSANERVVTLFGNTGTFSCTGSIRTNEAYTTQLSIQLEYGNSISTSKKVTIKSYRYSN